MERTAQRTTTSLASLAAVAALTLLAQIASAQGPSAEWRTLATPHFRVHYPAPAEAWTLRLAGRLEAVRARVAAEVGYDPPQVTDIVVADPVAQANGMALPLLTTPRMVVWASPPGPESVIGTYTDWAELLVLHEETHLVHLLRPSRNPWRALAEKLLPLGPLTTKAPRWVHEGYATQVEGLLTGSGRPNGDLRAAILRQRARAGRLPSYQAMSSDSQSWLGMSMAYLMGSAYLEWLAERSGSDSMRKLWARLTARQDRTFAQAFEGVFGDAPNRLYDRFTAELTWRAMEVERRLGGERRDGEVWQDLAWSTGEPALSPDGTRLAIVLRGRETASRIVVWAVDDNAEAEKKWREGLDEVLARDPADVAPVRARPLARKPEFELVTVNGAEPSAVRFTPDGKSLLFVRFESDSEGFLHPDLFRWVFGTRRVERLTHLADVRDADPAPGGGWAVAVRSRHGLSQLVRVELASGEVTALTDPTTQETFAAPRVSPDGGRLLFAVHRGGRWRLVVRDLTTREEVELPVPEDSSVAFPCWSRDGASVFASVGSGGIIDIVRISADGSSAMQAVTRTVGAALAPAPTPDGTELFFLGIEADGLDLRRIALNGAASPRVPVEAGVRAAAGSAPDAATDPALAPATRPTRPALPAPLEQQDLAPGRAYRTGRLEPGLIAGGSVTPSGRGWELGIRAGDVIGRFSTFALVAVGRQGGPRGGALAAAWRGWPVELAIHAFTARESPSEQRGASEPARVGVFDLEQSGVEMRGSWRRVWRGAALDLAGGALWNRIDARRRDPLVQTLTFADGRVSIERSRTPMRVFASLTGSGAVGRTGDAGWTRWDGTATLGVARKGLGVVLKVRRATLGGTTSSSDRLRLGGLAGSLLPASALGNRILDPALPAVTAVGTDYEGQRAEVTIGGLPLFFARHRIWDRAAHPAGAWLRLVGIGMDLASDPIPLVKLPGVHVDVGVARVLDEPWKDQTRWWLGVRWTP